MEDVLVINQIGGFYNQLYNIEEYLYDSAENNNYINANAIFWNNFFSIDNVIALVDKLCETEFVYSTKLQAVKSDPSLFINTFKKAINNIKSQNLDSRSCFKYLETLQIVCNIHTFLHSSPFELNIYEGYKHDQFSSEILKRKSIQKYSNPYYSFICDEIMPRLVRNNLKILWIKGRPNISGFCIASMIRQMYPDVFIVSIDNNSEFFSFSKITHLLKFNNALFSVFDCIVLNDNLETYLEVKKCILSNLDLSRVSNIIYSLDRGKSIICTDKKAQHSNYIKPSKDEISINKVINIKLFPNNQCYWNRCSFCAINKKYKNYSNCWDIEQPITQLKRLQNIGIDKFWATDEAIPIDTLNELCTALIVENLNFSWHVRTRIEKDILLNSLPQKLASSGLKHIIFGFESASVRVLRLMNKAENLDTYTELAEKIVNVFNDLGVYVHFPVIIGFPTESQRERKNTFDFLNYLNRKYPYFSYNINILNVDTSSKLYNQWGKYDISNIEYPCSPHNFIGNSVMWKSQTNFVDVSTLKIQANSQMKKQFNWYPNDTLIDANVFFSMWEYSRSPLNVKINKGKLKESVNLNKRLCLSPSTTMFQDDENLFCLYNFDNHNCVRGGQIIYDVTKQIQGNGKLNEPFYEPGNPIYNFINELYNRDFIEYI